MQIKVTFVAPIRPIAGKHELEIAEGSLLQDVLVELVKTFGPDAADCIFQKDGMTPYVYFWINGCQADMNSVLGEGMEIVVVPPIGGG